MLRSDPRIHYKMYKAKKNMVYATLFSFAVLGGLGLSQNAKADIVENNNVTPTVQTVANSAQSTTGAIPQSMPTQSAVPTQPTSAQPVVNSQNGSASNAASQTPTTTLNVQPAQPAQNFAATNRANLYTQSLVQVNQQSAVSNVKATYTCNNSGDVHNPGWTWPVDTQYAFDLDTTKAQLDHPIQIGQFEQSSDTGVKMSFATTQNYKPVYYHEQLIGNLSYDFGKNWGNTNTIALNFTLTTKPNAIGTIHLVGNYPGDIKVNLNWAANFRGIPLSHHTIKFVTNDGQTTTSLNFTVKQTQFSRWDQQDLNGIKNEIETEAKNSVFGIAQTDSDGSVGFTLNTYWPELDPDSVAEALHNDNVTTPVKTVNRTYLSAGRMSVANGTLLDNNFSKADGSQLGYTGGAIGTDSQGHYLINDNPTASYAANKLQIIHVAEGASLAQLKSMLDPTKDCLLISQQNDGSLLYLSNLTPTFFNSTLTDAQRLQDTNGFSTTNADSDPDKAAQISSDAIKNVFHNHPKYESVWLWTKLADPTVKTTVKVDNLDPNTGSVINSTSEDFIPNTYMAHGQAAVKLHVINATNGTELNQWRKLMSEARNKKK